MTLASTPPALGCPDQALEHLDALWIQVAGTLCNLACTHCLVSAGPGDDHHAFLSREAVRRHVRDGLELGVREVYFTGGEPFLHPRMLDILEDTLAHAPCTVLTNGTLFTRSRLRALRRLADASRYSLEIRVSLDGHTAETHDSVRGPGSFARALEGLRRLETFRLLPIVTATQREGEDPLALGLSYAAMLRAAGLSRPRLKLLPMMRLGREAERRRGDRPEETLEGLPQQSLVGHPLQCASCRAVTSRGVFVCPLLVDEPAARLGRRLAESLAPFRLAHGACHTCYVTGMTCANG